MQLLQSLPQPGKPVNGMSVPVSLVSTFKASLLARVNPTELRITPANKAEAQMQVRLPVLGVVGVDVFKDGEDMVIHFHLE